MDYTAHLDGALSRLHEEGRYRTFIDIEREKGNFPHAMWNCPMAAKSQSLCGVAMTIWGWVSILLF